MLYSVTFFFFVFSRYIILIITTTQTKKATNSSKMQIISIISFPYEVNKDAVACDDDNDDE